MPKKIQTVGELIRELREGKNLSHDTLAEALGTGRGTIIRWESGEHSPGPKYARALGSYFKRPWTNFLSEKVLAPTAEKRLTRVEERLAVVEDLAAVLKEQLTAVVEAQRQGGELPEQPNDLQNLS